MTNTQDCETPLHDCDTIVSPMIVERQIAGGVAQGVGGAFYEHREYEDNGNLLNASFMEFLMPYATEIPHLEMFYLETPLPLNPIGAKGVGGAGIIAVAQVIASGVQDALSPLGMEPFHRVPLNSDMLHAVAERARRKHSVNEKPMA
ncbi:MAG: molybdopterin-dependent oxidoreductase [Nocardioides sp.]|nr:molybdopterin-dependent oxidoreductase [Nocardioides sp.]